MNVRDIIKKVLLAAAVVVMAAIVWSLFNNRTSTPPVPVQPLTATETPSVPGWTEIPTPTSTYGIATDSELAFVDHAVVLEGLIAKSSDYFSKGDFYTDKAINYMEKGINQWYDEWRYSECPSTRLQPIYALTRKLSKNWAAVCISLADYLSGETSIDKVLKQLTRASMLQKQLLTELEAWDWNAESV
jgi:hypothetical protein